MITKWESPTRASGGGIGSGAGKVNVNGGLSYAITNLNNNARLIFKMFIKITGKWSFQASWPQVVSV